MMVARNKGRTIVLRKDMVGIPKSVLGLDVSSRTVGWGLVSGVGKHTLIAHGHIRPLPSKYDIIMRLSDLYDRVQSLCKELSPSVVAVEDIVLFVKERSTAKTITILAAFNRVAALAAYRMTDNVKFYPVGSIRKIIKDAVEFGRTPGKDEIPGIIREFLETEFSDVEKRGGGTAVQTYDEADGIAVAWSSAQDLNREVIG